MTDVSVSAERSEPTVEQIGDLKRRLSETKAAASLTTGLEDQAALPRAEAREFDAGSAHLDEVDVLDASSQTRALLDEVVALADDAVASAEKTSDTLARTYRGLRIVVLGAAPTIFLAAFLVWRFVLDGQSPPTLSHYYYTPAGIVFVGALVAAAAALVALAGQGAERVLLDIAAFFCPLIALIPTPLNARWAVAFTQDVSDFPLTPAQIAQIETACAHRCVPAPFDRYVTTSLGVWLVVVVAVLLLTFIGAMAARRSEQPAPLSTWVVLGVVTALLIIYVAVWTWLPGIFQDFAHVISASTFLILLAVVALLQRRRPVGRTPKEVADNRPAALLRVLLKRSLPCIGILMLISLTPVFFILIGVLDPEQTSFPTLVLWVEVVALSLFTLFWLIQTHLKWEDPDA